MNERSRSHALRGNAYLKNPLKHSVPARELTVQPKLKMHARLL